MNVWAGVGRIVADCIDGLRPQPHVQAPVVSNGPGLVRSDAPRPTAAQYDAQFANFDGTISPQLLASVKRGEGCRLTSYKDSKGYWTWGWGERVGAGPGRTCTQEYADEQLIANIHHAQVLCHQHLPWLQQLNQPRQDVLTEMMFNMGWLTPDGDHGLGTFVRTLAKCGSGDFDGTADGMLASHWHADVGARAERLAAQMRSGSYVA